jgi:hypothetical protein
MVLMVSMAERALALDCLAYKPERAQGQWHADVVSGKICWYGPNWRSFLPKPKTRMESSLPANSKLKMRVVNRKPDTQVVKTEVENSKPDVLVEIRKPDTQVVKVENSKPNVQIENGKADISVVPTSPLAQAVDLDRAQESSDSGKPGSVKAAEFTNAVSSELEPKPAVSNATIPGMTSEPQSITDLLVAFSIIALGTIGLVTLIMRGIGQQGFYTDIEEQPLEYTFVDEELAPPLQPDANDEHDPLERAGYGFLTQSIALPRT